MDSAAARSAMDNDAEAVPFEEVYAAAAGSAEQVPWALSRPHPLLVDWLDSQPAPPSGTSGLVVGCGLGDDAEELASRGFQVTAFDAAPTAIDWCHRRFLGSAVDYRVADLFALPTRWRAGFDLVIEINTIQALPPARRRAAIAAVAGTVAPGGAVLVECFGRADTQPPPTSARPPWPVSRSELAAFTEYGLAEATFTEVRSASGDPRFQIRYTR